MAQTSLRPWKIVRYMSSLSFSYCELITVPDQEANNIISIKSSAARY